MRKFTLIVVCMLIVITIASCGESVSWNTQEETIYNEFLALQEQVNSKMDYLLTNKPETFADAKITGGFVWEWKSYENSSISSIYKTWRTSAGTAVESRARMFFYIEDDPNYTKVKAEADFAEESWKIDTEELKKAVEVLKSGGNPLTK